MKRLGKYILAAIVTASCGAASAQTFNSAYFTDDFKFRHTLNPAFGNEQTISRCPHWAILVQTYTATSAWATLS